MTPSSALFRIKKGILSTFGLFFMLTSAGAMATDSHQLIGLGALQIGTGGAGVVPARKTARGFC